MTQQTTAAQGIKPVRHHSPAWILAACVLLAITAAAIFLAYWHWHPQGPTSSDPQRVRSALAAAAAYLAGTELRGDDAWIATQGAMKLGPAYRTWAETLNVTPLVESDLKRNPLTNRTGGGIEGRLWGMRWLAESEAPRLPAPNVSPAHQVSNALSEEDLHALIRLMALTSVCSELAPADRQEWLDALGADSHSYLLTHQLLAVMLGRNRGCLDEAAAEGLRQHLATNLWIEQAADRSGINDLSAERMAMLCYAQVCDWLRPEWIDDLLARQEASGSWGELNPEVNPRVVARPEHTAALAFYVLAATWEERFGNEPAPEPPQRQ